ncbi:MAG: AAA family ATPase [Lachnospiraceae bacterium]|nr:AAA family ATPase [Lachnospiraceae bacterium]
MRYYGFLISGNDEYIKKNAAIRLRDYAYENAVAGLNNYMYKNLKNNVCFLIYREEGNTLLSIFSFDERKVMFADAYEQIREMLASIFRLKDVIEEPDEITMLSFWECLNEAKRRDYMYGQLSYIISASKLWINYYYHSGNSSDELSLRFEFREDIISENDFDERAILDKSLKEELKNIEDHMNGSGLSGNLVHYIISGRSIDAAGEMTQILVGSLLRANRLAGKRVEIISDMEPNFFRSNDKLEEIIENNAGGVVILDLSCKFGYEPADYVLTGKYIVKLLKQYRNHCLFVFTYNMDDPGFSYLILPEVRKYVIPVALREGTGNRKEAVNYLKSLIERSEYSEYSEQAGEFLKNFPGESFSQTDVLSAFEQFGSWSLNRNVLKAYDYVPGEDFMADRDENAESSYDRLQNLTGLKIVKEQIDSIIASDLVEKERKKRKGKEYHSSSMHMIFGGNPGSAKTTVARLFAMIAKEKGILKSGAFVEKGGLELDGLGCAMMIKDAFITAKGGVLFIDEAYSLRSESAITALLREMENHRDEVIVILAGYNERMHSFVETNEGLKSRIPYWIEFPDYDADELTDIFMGMVRERGFRVTKEAAKNAHYIFDKVRHADNFGNGRYVRNLIERAIQNQAVRLMAKKDEAGNITGSELFLITKEDIGDLDEGLKEERTPGSAKKELEEMIGLSTVKEVIGKAMANYKFNRLCAERGLGKNEASMHMVFTGNPGTAKTTVARLFAEMMKDEKVLPTGNFVEASRADLVGDHVGATAPMVKRKFREAKGGVLFIDEAYSLCDGYRDGFGDEAINTLVKEMEDQRNDVIVIFAGYPEPMKRFLQRNPGMRSRIAFNVGFDDYSVEELCDITKLMLAGKQMKITDKAMEKLKSSYEKAKEDEDFGNGRFVRKVLEEAQMNLANRVLCVKGPELSDDLVTTITEYDIPEMTEKKEQEKFRPGFAV